MYSMKVLPPKRAKHNRSHEVKLTCDFGTLVPILCEEVIPGDIYKCSTEIFTRFSALIAPVMQRIDARIEYFFVPNRILWSGWQDFITGDTSQVPPFITTAGILNNSVLKKHSLADYLGFPVAVNELDDSADPGTLMFAHIPNDYISALPFKAYQRIWHDYYMDENLVTNPWGSKPDDFSLSGGDLTSEYGTWMALRNRAWSHDYFTSALPWAQKGDAVRLPLMQGTSSSQYVQIKSDKFGSAVTGASVNSSGNLVTTTSTGNASPNFKIQNLQGPTIEEVRRANAVQRWLEKNARFGSRYVEQILAHFGVKVPDYRLDRAEFLGSGKVNVRVSEVLQQSETTQGGALGDQAGHAIAGGAVGFRKYHVQEHGFIIALLSFVPQTGYGANLSKMWMRREYLDYAFPEFDRLGEQPIYNYEVDAYGTGYADVFGYQPRYDEYKHTYSKFCGDFRDTLSYWHLGRLFGGHGVALNDDFITIRPYDQDAAASNDRIFATQDETDKHIMVQIYHHLPVKRPLGRYVPSL